MSERVPITIIGGGVIGCAIAHALSHSLDKSIFLIERNPRLAGENQSSRNSGVIHAGLYHSKEKAPMKARFCVEGNRMLYDFCAAHGIPHKRTGKLVVATNADEEAYLDAAMQIAIANNVPGVQKLSGPEANRLEPNVKATAALYLPLSGIIDATSLVKKLASLAEDRNTFFVTGNEVVDITPLDSGFKITTVSGSTQDHFVTDLLINTAGLYSDSIARMVNPKSPYEIRPIRGESVQFNQSRRPGLNMNGHNVYPAPYGVWPNGDKADLPFDEFVKLFRESRVTRVAGVHLTPTFEEIGGKYEIGRTVTIGPALVGNVDKEDYKRTKPSDYFFECVKNFFPALNPDDIEFWQTGIVAMLKDHHDFVIERDPEFRGCINCIGISSPGLTASLAIADYVKGIVLSGEPGT